MNLKKLVILINMADSFNHEKNKLALNMPLHQTSIVLFLYEKYLLKHKIFLEFDFEIEICLFLFKAELCT